MGGLFTFSATATASIDSHSTLLLPARLPVATLLASVL